MKVAFSEGRASASALCLACVLGLFAAGPSVAAQNGDVTPPPKTRAGTPAKTQAGTSSASSAHKARKQAKARRRTRTPVGKAARAAQAARLALLRRAFVASSELRPMAQQLGTMRTPAAYAGVTAYARRNTGEAAAAAYLALGHAYLLDKRYGDAETNLRLARQAGEELADYADFLGAKANHEAGNESAAETLLRGFTDRYPDSIFAPEAPELEANALLATGNAAGAHKVLVAAAAEPGSDRAAFELAEGQVAFKLGQQQEAERIFKRLLLGHPLSQEAEIARARLTSMGAETNLTTAELRSLGDAYYNAGRYDQASEQYHALARKSGLDAATRNGFAVAAAACDLKLKRLTPAQVQGLADTPDEDGARRLYLLMELARNRNDTEDQQRIVNLMESRFPRSPWLADALYSSGNMYLLRKEYPTAAQYYNSLANRFPSSAHAAGAHWRAGWLTYRQGLYADAARLFDEQIRLFPNATETVSALYWRGRLYETLDRRGDLAVAHYRTVVRAYQHYFYAQMSRIRLAALSNMQPATDPQLDRFQPQPVPQLDGSFPADSPRLAKARLVANAGLNEYVAQEIAADPDSSSWSALAEAQIYTSYGETFRALRALKRALPFASTASIRSIPIAYWRILFPEPWWDTIKVEAAKNNLDPFLVASLIRQESEFNPSAISRANAYGLMQLLPAVGKAMAREEGSTHFETFQLLDPVTNIRLGTRYLRHTIDKFGGVTEYALAAYNAGDDRVLDWQAAGPYQGIDEFVESIPFTETRDYVQAILRNQETYKAIEAFETSQAGVGVTASR